MDARGRETQLAGQQTIYQNGVATATAALTADTATRGYTMLIGGVAASDIGMQGAVDEVTVYDRALAAAEIAAIHAAGPRGKCRAP